MRSLILVILSAATLAGLFVFVWTLQPAASKPLREQQQQAHDAPARPKPQDGFGPIKPGERVWIKQYDRDGQLVSRFSGDQYLPQPDGTVKIINPEADFFLANHQHMEVTGVDGNVVMKEVPNLAQNGFGNAAPPAPPSRGRLNQVTVRLIDETTHAPLITMRTNNVVFDNETYRISTEGYKDEQGNSIKDDEVPVFVDGEITLRGRGLTVRWNDKDGRLDLLEIAHGEVLVVNDPSTMSLGGGGGGARSPKPAPRPAARARGPLPGMLAAADKAAAGEILTHHPAPSPTPRPGADAVPARAKLTPIYRASFFDNVRINQPNPQGTGDQVQIDDVDRMDVDFLMKQSSPATQPVAAGPATQPAAPVTTAPAEAAAPTTAPAATQSATAKEPPIYVHWTGPLRITPLQSAPLVPLKSGDSCVLLVGQPVKVHRVDPKDQGTEDIRSATVLYATAGERVLFGKSDRFPQILIDKAPAASAKEHDATHLVSSGAVDYSRGDGKALLTGPGTAQVPLEPDPKTPHPVLHATWSKLAEFDFTPETAGRQPTVTFGHFEGDVDVQHPKLALKSQALDLLFDPPAGSADKVNSGGKSSGTANIRQIIATTGVWCQVEASDGKPQHLTSERLVLDTDKSDGKLYARHLLASGGAHAWGDDDLRARSIDVLLHPSQKKPKAAAAKPGDDTAAAAVELERMVATGQVIARSKDGSVATGDRLVVTTPDGKQHVVITSDAEATVTDAKGNIVRGPEIQFDAADGRARVVGPGSMRAIQQASTTQPAQPVDVTWARGALFDGDANRIDVYGAVHATSTDKKGFVDTATGDHIRIDLRAKPTTQPVRVAEGGAGAGSNAATQPSGGTAGAGNLKLDPFKGKEVAAITIEKGPADAAATIASTLAGPGGDVMQQFELLGPVIHVDEFAADGTPSRTVTVPAAGRMLTRDHRPPPAKDKAAENQDGSSARGATAFQWEKLLVYAEVTHRADMTGNVLVVHRDDEPGSAPVQMKAEHVIAWFEVAPKNAAKKAGDDAGPMQLRYLSAEGANVIVTRGTDEVVARQIDYDPKRHLLIATGTDRNPVTFNNGGASSGTAERIEWDTITWKMRATHAIVDDRPPVPVVQSPPQPAKKKLDLPPAAAGSNKR